MADANDTAADDGQWTTTTENTVDSIDGPGPPQGAINATVNEGGNANNDEDMNNVSPNTHDACQYSCVINSCLIVFNYRVATPPDELSRTPRLPRMAPSCKSNTPAPILTQSRFQS